MQEASFCVQSIDKASICPRIQSDKWRIGNFYKFHEMATVTNAACGSSDGESENEPGGPESVDPPALAALGLGNGALEALKEHLQDHAIGGPACYHLSMNRMLKTAADTAVQATSGTVEVQPIDSSSRATGTRDLQSKNRMNGYQF